MCKNEWCAYSWHKSASIPKDNALEGMNVALGSETTKNNYENYWALLKKMLRVLWSLSSSENSLEFADTLQICTPHLQIEYFF